MQSALGSLIDLVTRIEAAEEVQVQKGSNQCKPYLRVTGIVMGTKHVGPLRLGDFGEGDLEVGNICITRGLKIIADTVYDDSHGKWVNNMLGEKTLGCDSRTSIEDVTDVTEITKWF